MKSICILLGIAFFTISCSQTYEEKLQESIDIINAEANYKYLALEEGSGLDPLPIVDDSIMSYIIENPKFEVLEQITIKNAPKVTAEGYKKLKKLKNLRLLRLEELPINNRIVNTLFKDLDSIGSIGLYNIPDIDSIIISSQKNWLSVDIERCPKLKNIHLKNSPKLVTLTVNSGARTNPLSIQIENSRTPIISFSNSNMMTPMNISSDSSYYSLGFYHCDFSKSAPDFFSSFDRMTDLRIVDSDINEILFKGLSKLKKIHIQGIYESGKDTTPLIKVSLDDLPSLSEFLVQSNTLKKLNFKRLDSLKRVYLSGVGRNFSISGFDAIKNIEGIELSGESFNDELFDKITSLPNLSYLGYHTDTITKTQFVSIKNAPRLKRINISPVKDIDELNDLLQIEGIEYLDINESDISTITIADHPSLEVFTAKSGKNIENITISNCQNLSDLYLNLSYPKHVRIQNIPNLKLLKLGLCKLNNRQEFINNLARLKSLMYLSLEICNTDQTIDLRTLDKLLYIPVNTEVNELFLNKALEGVIDTHNYTGSIKYVE